MQRNSLVDQVDSSRCILTREGAWVRATWSGFIDLPQAMRGAASYLVEARLHTCPYLLNDNLALYGPWFDSLEWLERAWLPHALELGLRCVAHVVQADTRTDMLTLAFPAPVVGTLELQLFYELAPAEEWLRSKVATSGEPV